MIEEEGRVVALGHHEIYVEVTRQSTCSSCQVKQDCGQSFINKYRLPEESLRVAVSDASAFQKDDQVVLGLPESALVKVSVTLYLLPLLSMMACIWLSGVMEWSDTISAAVALLGLGSGLLVARLVSQRDSELGSPKVLRNITQLS